MEAGKYVLHRRATMALHQLPPDEQAAVQDRVGAITSIPPGEWPAEGVKRLADNQPLYLLRVNDSLRVILRVVAGQRPEVLDVVRHETLESFVGTGG